MALPNWTVELIRRSLNEVAEKARQPESLEKLKSQASEILSELPETAARGIDAVMRGAEASRKSVEKWAREYTQLSVPMLNASGTLETSCGTGVALADEVLGIGREVLAGDLVRGAEFSERLAKRLSKSVSGLKAEDSSATDVLVTSSFSSAIASLAAFSASRTMVVHRSDCVRLIDGQVLPSVLASLGVPMAGLRSTVMEVGALDHRDATDFDGIQRACIVTTETRQRSLSLFGPSDPEAIEVAVLPCATLKQGFPASFDVPSVQSALSSGADLVVCPGDVVIGGAACGIVVGRTDLLDEIKGCPAWNSIVASDATMAMAAVALEMNGSDPVASPVGKLIEVSIENLKSRAERLATRWSGEDNIASCQVTADDAWVSGQSPWRVLSRQIRVRHRSKSAEDWAKSLREQSSLVLARVDGESLVIDLRWIDASQDAVLGQLISDH